jgi:hypothetical protein
MLRNNVSMMQSELNKICNRFKIGALNRDDLSQYPPEQRDKLQTAVNCCKAAEKTLTEFKVVQAGVTRHYLVSLLRTRELL